MNVQHHLVLALCLPLLCSCALFSSERPAPGRVQDFVGAVERVYVEAELVRDRAASAVRALQSIAAADFGQDAIAAYGQLDQALASSEQQAAALGTAVEEMKDNAQPVFEHWAADIERIANTTLQDRSQQRFAAARERFDSILHVIEPTLLTCQQLNRDIRDHLLFLGHDLNAQSLADIQAGVAQLSQAGAEVDQSIEQALGAARQYLEVSSLPVGAPATPAR